MMHRQGRYGLGILGLLGVAAMTGFPQGGPPPARVTSDQLGGPDRYLIHISTDKPIYRAGETIYVRGVVLHALSHKPLPPNTNAWAAVEIIGPKGEIVNQGGAAAQDSAVAYSWTVPDGQPGGGYKVKMSLPAQGYPTGERGFEVRAFRTPRLKSQIVFLRDGYGAGDDVTATLSVERAEGGFPVGAKVTLVAMVDGREAARQSAGTVDSAGRCVASFRLPKVIERGEGTLALVVEDGGVVETATKTIPILVNAVDLTMFAEGGELVSGLPTRLYVEARTPSRKPADIAAVIESTDGKVVARLRTEHEGRGRVDLSPNAGQHLRLRITEPAGITKTYDLPDVRERGGVLLAADDVVAAGASARLRVGTTMGGASSVTVSKQEKEVASKKLDLVAGQVIPAEIPLPKDADGVLRVTLWDATGFPLAERLVYRTSAEALQVTVKSDHVRYVPGGSVDLTVKATRPDGTPVSAVVGVSVSDDSVRELIETRDHPPQLPVQVLLEDDVWELTDAQIYLDPKNPKAPRAVDLLLGTQGWRRFVYVGDPVAFLAKSGDRARRALAFMEPQPVMSEMMDDGGGMLRGAMPPAPGAMPKGMPVPAPVAAAPARPEPQEAAEKKPMVAPKQDANMPAADAKSIADDDGILARRKVGKDMRALGYLGNQAQAPVVREYAHSVRPDRKPGDRRDFAETLYWSAGIRTDATGEAHVRFGLSDAVTSFRVLADAWTDTGSLGAATATVESVEPFYLEPKLPLEVTYGDVVKLPVSIVNGTLEPLHGVTLIAMADAPLATGSLPPLDLSEEERARRILEIKIGEKAGPATLTLTGKAGAYVDEVTRTLKVAPLGFPATQSFGGMLAPSGRVSHTVTVPADVVKGSIRASVKVFPTSLGKLTSALERLIQEPNGCFEQTSSTTYPLVMAQQYFTTHVGVDPALVTKSHELLSKGYDRLTGFECKTKGYEWFGESPGHEALSAFGILEFSDMSKVQKVDQAMIDRTREWLLAQRDGKGGFKRERRALHTWIEDVDCSNGYILWSLLRTGEKGLDPEIDAFGKAAKASNNSYVHALAANVMQLANRKADADAFLDGLSKSQNAGGFVDGATASIVGSTGDALNIETTALATLAWLRSPAHQGNVEKAIHYLADSCQGGRYGSTQSTVLALQAIVQYDQARSKPKAPGTVTLWIDGKSFGSPVSFDDKTQDALTLPDPGASLTTGKHTVELAMDKGSEMPYAVEVTLHSLTPATSSECQVTLEVDLSHDALTEGEIADATVLVGSKSSEPLPMAVAIVGLPGGLEPRHEQLKELVRSKTVAAYEVIGRDVVLYFRSLEPNAVKRVPLSLVAAVPGTYTGPASRVYLYYGDEHKSWVPGFTVRIAPR